MKAIVSALQLTGLLLLTGGLFYRQFIWNPVLENANGALIRRMLRRTTVLTILGAILFATAGLAELLLFRDMLQADGAAEGLPGSGISPRYLVLIQGALAALFTAGVLISERHDSVFPRVGTFVAGLAIICTLAATSHAAAEPGLLATASSITHWIAVTAWGGCLIYLALQRWSDFYRECEQGGSNIGRVVEHYAKLSAIAFALFLVSGMLLAFVHVHNVDAMNTTYYGQALMLKVAAAALLVILFSINLLKTAPSCRENRRNPIVLKSLLQRFRKSVIAETILLGGLIVTSGILATHSAPGVAPFLRPQTWHMTAGELPLTVQLQPVAGSSTRARFEISAASANYLFPEGMRAEFTLSTLRSDTGIRSREALPIGPSSFLGEAVLAIPGTWLFEIRLDYPNQKSLTGEYELVVPAQPLAQDLQAYLIPAAIGFSPSSTITFIVGILLVLSAGWLTNLCRSGKAPHWIMPVSMINMALGGYLALSVVFMKSYPTTFRSNPQPYTAEVIRHGETIYRNHCARCHGITGKGDGPWAKAERGSIPDLTAPHMDAHTDGEVFWWITNGIPSLGMPALGDKISVKDRWAVINSVRSLRHGLPASQPAGAYDQNRARTPAGMRSSL